MKIKRGATLEQFIARGWLQDFTDIYRLDNHRDEIIRMDGFAHGVPR